MSNVTELHKNHPFLYIISCGKKIKIGVSVDPVGRVKDMQTGCPHHLKCIYKVRFDKRPYKLEKKMHDLLNVWHLRGEWFEVNPIHLPRFIECVAAYTYDMTALEIYEDSHSLMIDEHLEAEDVRLTRLLAPHTFNGLRM